MMRVTKQIETKHRCKDVSGMLDYPKNQMKVKRCLLKSHSYLKKFGFMGNKFTYFSKFGKILGQQMFFRKSSEKYML